MEIIRSKDNPKVKRLSLLHDRKKARGEGLVFIEGTRLCEDALISGAMPSVIAYTEKRSSYAQSLIEKYGLTCEQIVMTDECFSKISSTSNPQGIAMAVPEPSLYKEIPFRNDGKDIYVVLENLQDPGNLGTIIRLADAFDLTAVIMTRGSADPYNEKVLRSSMGSVWHIPVVTVDSLPDLFSFFKDKGITTLSCDLNGKLLPESRIDLPAAYFIGNEGAGLTEETVSSCDIRVKIPMPGKAESLNAASAASIIGYVLASLR
ncbi:MAG: RNA methyltransferase [Clostridiales bacterium]|nr:RNA methyltransferase [Clostridiales bacterium]